MALSLVEFEQAKHRPAPSDQIAVEPMEFDARFGRPRTTVHIPLDRLHGRCGDLIVYQLRGASHSPENQQATLRSLGLGSYCGSSLRWSNDEVTNGYLRTVRHLVGIVKLDRPCYKEWISPLYETQQYGTQSRPGQVWRALTGQYIGYWADSTGVALYMSTEHNFADVLPRIQSTEIGMEPDFASTETRIALRDSLGEWSSRRGHFGDVIDGIDLVDVRHASIPIKSIGRVSLSTVTMTLTWEADVQKFHDVERISNELGLMSVKKFVREFAGFRDQFSEIANREDCPVSMSILERGRRVDVAV